MEFRVLGYTYRNAPVYVLQGPCGAVEWCTEEAVWHYPQEAFPPHAACYPCEILGGRCGKQRDRLPARLQEVFDTGDLVAIEEHMLGDYRTIEHASSPEA